MKKLKIIFAAALCAIMTACTVTNDFSNKELLSRDVKRRTDSTVTYNYADGAHTPPSSYNNFANTATAFSLKLLRRSYNSEAFSLAPMNCLLQLGLLANGAKNDTRSEILLALGSELGMDAFNTCCSYFKSRMNNVGKIFQFEQDHTKESAQTLTMSGALLINDQTDVRSSFLQTNADFYGDDVICYNFSSGADKLKSYLSSDKMTLDGDDFMVSYSFLTLSDSWLNRSLNAEEMYMRSDTAHGIIKYTSANPIKALFIMPDVNFDKFVKAFDSVVYNKLLDSVDVTRRRAASIPEFRTCAAENELSPVLQTLGLHTIWDENNAAFTNLTYDESPALSLFYDSTPPFSVTAQGLDTSAADAVYTATDNNTDAEWHFDKPFIFMLVDNETNIPIYISTIQ